MDPQPLCMIVSGTIVAKCPGLARTVPEFGALSRLCPGLAQTVLMSQNLTKTALSYVPELR